MKVGLRLHPEAGVDAVFEEARRADEQGFDSIWLSDHMMNPYGDQGPDGPLDYFVLATALGAITKRVKLSWGVLSLTFRPPALFAKMIASLDQITRGRVICTVGSGWLLEEYKAYNLPLLEDHDERAAYAREVVALWKQLWTHPAPERVTFEGRFVRVDEIQFNPKPYQQPHPPIWFGGDSEATLESVRQYADGWVPLASGRKPDVLRKVIGAPDWPRRKMTVARGSKLVVAESRAAVMKLATREYEATKLSTPRQAAPTFEEFLEREIVGTPDECLDQLAELESWGINYLRLDFVTEEAQDQAARLLLPRLSGASV